jgi:hypothetical protein
MNPPNKAREEFINKTFKLNEKLNFVTLSPQLQILIAVSDVFMELRLSIIFRLVSLGTEITGHKFASTHFSKQSMLVW